MSHLTPQSFLPKNNVSQFKEFQNHLIAWCAAVMTIIWAYSLPEPEKEISQPLYTPKVVKPLPTDPDYYLSDKILEAELFDYLRKDIPLDNDSLPKDEPYLTSREIIDWEDSEWINGYLYLLNANFFWTVKFKSIGDSKPGGIYYDRETDTVYLPNEESFNYSSVIKFYLETLDIAEENWFEKSPYYQELLRQILWMINILRDQSGLKSSIETALQDEEMLTALPEMKPYLEDRLNTAGHSEKLYEFFMGLYTRLQNHMWWEEPLDIRKVEPQSFQTDHFSSINLDMPYVPMWVKDINLMVKATFKQMLWAALLQVSDNYVINNFMDDRLFLKDTEKGMTVFERVESYYPWLTSIKNFFENWYIARAKLDVSPLKDLPILEEFFHRKKSLVFEDLKKYKYWKYRLSEKQQELLLVFMIDNAWNSIRRVGLGLNKFAKRPKRLTTPKEFKDLAYEELSLKWSIETNTYLCASLVWHSWAIMSKYWFTNYENVISYTNHVDLTVSLPNQTSYAFDPTALWAVEYLRSLPWNNYKYRLNEDKIPDSWEIDYWKVTTISKNHKKTPRTTWFTDNWSYWTAKYRGHSMFYNLNLRKEAGSKDVYLKWDYDFSTWEHTPFTYRDYLHEKTGYVDKDYRAWAELEIRDNKIKFPYTIDYFVNNLRHELVHATMVWLWWWEYEHFVNSQLLLKLWETKPENVHLVIRAFEIYSEAMWYKIEDLFTIASYTIWNREYDDEKYVMWFVHLVDYMLKRLNGYSNEEFEKLYLNNLYVSAYELTSWAVDIVKPEKLPFTNKDIQDLLDEKKPWWRELSFITKSVLDGKWILKK